MRNFLLYILIISACPSILAQESWNTNLLDYSFNKNARKMIFREPITFSPFELKAGYFHYGGSDYLNDFSLLTGDIGTHPVILDSTHSAYNGLSSKKDRKGIFIEVDLLKTNLLLKLIPQNVFDVQFGLGYRISHMLSHPKLPSNLIYSNPDESWQQYKFFPKIHDFNFNTTVQWQFNQLFIPYLYHSIGFSKISLYKTEADRKYLYGDAISETFAIGVKKIIEYEASNKYNLYYGCELKSLRTTTLNLDDPQQFSPIVGFDMRGVNLNLTFGVIFGGKRTIGDEAFSMMLENDYDNAIPAFEQYIEDYPNHGKIKKAKKMLAFCRQELPYKIYKNAIDHLDNNNLKDAVIALDEAYAGADDSLKIEIDLTKQGLAKELALDLEKNFNLMSIDDCESKIDYLSDISPSAKDDVQLMKGELFFRKATLLHESNFFTDALKYYQISLSYNNELSKLVDKRIDTLIDDILIKSSEYQKEDELILAVESLKLAANANNKLSYRLNPIISMLESQIEKLESQETQKIMQEIIRNNKSKSGDKNKDLIIGMTKDIVVDYISMPDNIEFITSSLDSYEIWIYSAINKRLFFKNNRLHHIENLKD
tara:strand:+ start:3235 stop:5025 length:1791 start_codon:yes stop_codon:yes gene_type:complete